MFSEILNKNELRRIFSKDYKSYYSTKLFEDEGFERRKCSVCGMNFWSVTDRETCGDPSHTPYSFFKDKPRSMKYDELWKKFEKFFVDNGHTSIERYPVVSRWRPDLYFTIASIQDFQRIENGAMSFEYAANPLVVPQICLRFNDIENVGMTGRHTTSFMMAGQHAFDYPKKGYWRDETIALNYKFLTQVIGVRKDDLVYIEDAWAMGDFSEFGPCLESFSNGLEMVNSVFTQFESVNGNVRELKGKVVDVGWGFERLLWFYTGFDTMYEAVFHDILKKISPGINIEMDKTLFRKYAEMSSELDVTERDGSGKGNEELLERNGITKEDYERKIRPLQALYAVLDHTRTLLFATTDGALPSNIGGGYNLRVILRRALSFIEEYKLGLDMTEIADMMAGEMKMYPELKENIGLFSNILEIESKRYRNSRENTSKIIKTMISKGKNPTRDELRTLYESNGVTPELLKSAASMAGVRMDIPEGAYEGIMKGDFVKKTKARNITVDEELPKTEQLYYSFETRSTSKTLYVNGNYVVLDKTPFYPEGGGQEADHGKIDDLNVVDVQKIGDVIVHITDVQADKKLKKGAMVNCIVDKDRRERLMAHHTATHLISASVRNVIGKHAWQEGARKSAGKAHIDVAHYDKLTDKEIEAIEDFANEALLHGIKVKIENMERGEAERRFGFAIYQGHGVPSKIMRMVIIEDLKGNVIDAEACGGMHVASRESLIGMIKIIGTQRIHDGVDRIEFVAGRASKDYFRREDKELLSSSERLNVDKFDLLKKVESTIESITTLSKSYLKIEDELASEIANSFLQDVSKSKDLYFERKEPRALLRKAADMAVSENPKISVTVKNDDGEVVCISGEESGISALESLRNRFGKKFKGGGSARIAEGMIVGE
jgi:alanyl-tRNA synthetase